MGIYLEKYTSMWLRVEPDTDPVYAIEQINSFLSKIGDLQQEDCENSNSERDNPIRDKY